MHSTFRQELEIRLSLLAEWQVALLGMYYTHSFGNAVLRSAIDFHCQVGYIIPPASFVSTRSVQLARHQRFTHVHQVLQDLSQRLGLRCVPTLTGGTYCLGQMHMHFETAPLPDFPSNPKLDYFRRDLVEDWLARCKTLPISYTETQDYINGATSTLMGDANIKYIWNLKPSPTKSTNIFSVNLPFVQNCVCRSSSKTFRKRKEAAAIF